MYIMELLHLLLLGQLFATAAQHQVNTIDVAAPKDDFDSQLDTVKARDSDIADSSGSSICPRRSFVNGITNTDGNELPSQLHMSLTGKDASNKNLPTGVSVSWYLSNNCSCIVEYQIKGWLHAKSSVASQPPVQYLKNYGWHYTAILSPLQAATDYQYRVGCTCGSESETQSNSKSNKNLYNVDIDAACMAKRSKIVYSDYVDFFTSWTKSEVKIAIFGDHGYLGNAERGREYFTHNIKWDAKPAREILMANKESTDMYWEVGDIAYADDGFLHKPFGFTYEAVYSNYMTWMKEFMQGKPYMVSPGNHESECHGPGCVVGFERGAQLRNFSAYNSRWHMPSKESGGVMNMWYSFDYAGAHFVSMNSETDWKGAEEEGDGDSDLPELKSGHFNRYKNEYLDWLEKDLAAAHALKQKGELNWIIAGSHRPLNQVIPKDNGTKIFDLFAKYEVDMYFCGHEHQYGRQNQLHPMPTADTSPFDLTGDGWSWSDLQQRHRQSSSNINGATMTKNRTTVLILSGGSGCDEMPQNNTVFHDDWPKGWYENFRYYDYSMGFLTINSTALRWELHDAITNIIVDSIVITKDNVIDNLAYVPKMINGAKRNRFGESVTPFEQIFV